MIEIDETRMLEVSQRLHFGTVGIEHVRNIINRANKSNVIKQIPDSVEGTPVRRFTALYRGYGAEVAAKHLGLRRTADIEVLREYLGVRELSPRQNQHADETAIAVDSAQRIYRAQQGWGIYPEFDETRVFEVVRGELGSRTNVSAGHLRQVIAEARHALGVRPDAGTDDDLHTRVADQIGLLGLNGAAEILAFSSPTDSARQKDLYFLRNFLGLHEMGPEGASRAFAHRQVGERREFDDYRRAGD